MFNLTDLTYWTTNDFLVEINGNDWKYLLKYSSWSRPCGQWPLQVLGEASGRKRCFEEPRFELRQTRSGSGSSAMWLLPGTQSVLLKIGKTNKTNQNIRSQNYINVYQKKRFKKSGTKLGAQNNTCLPQRRIKPPIHMIPKMPECHAQGQRSLQWSPLHRISNVQLEGGCWGLRQYHW